MSDISLNWLASYPKSGNTWARTFIQNLVKDGEEPEDINELQTGSVGSSRSWLDYILGFDTAELTVTEVDHLRPIVYDWTAARSGGYHKIHDALTDMKGGDPVIGRNTKAQVVYFIRNPLDVAPSYAHHNATGIDKAISQMANDAHCLSQSNDALRPQTRQRLLSWSNHVRSWTEASWLDLLIIRYEDMHSDTVETFAKMAEFLDLPTELDKIEKAIKFSEFKELKRQESKAGFRERPPKMSHFFRSGQVGGWRESLNEEQVSKIISDHGEVMRRFGYLDSDGQPV